jgi:hypothetical protein
MASLKVSHCHISSARHICRSAVIQNGFFRWRVVERVIRKPKSKCSKHGEADSAEECNVGFTR